jgi:thiamine biosynthesis lipoprotein
VKLRLSPALWIICAIQVRFAVQAADLPQVTWEGRTMGSGYVVKLVGSNLAPEQRGVLQAAVEQRLVEVNRQMSHYDPDSALSRFNRGPAGIPFAIPPGFAKVIWFSLELNRRSHRAFDPTMSPLINLWGFGEKSDQRAVPPAEELRATLAQIGCGHLSLSARNELIKDIPELSINLSGVAKGHGVDEMVRVLQEHGFTNVYAAIAGEVRTLGHNARGTKWQVGISAPVAHWRENDPMAAVVELSNQALSTSGDYQKFFTDAQCRRLSHLLDPRTGWPVQHQVGSVSVVAPDGMTADGLATTLFVLGLDEGLRFIEGWTNAAAVFIVRESENRFRPIPSSRFASLTGYRP